jgi:hypothetical protein
MANVFKKSVPMMLRRVGTPWSTTVDGECLHFYGIFDDEEGLENDTTGKTVVVRRAVVLVETKVARKFSFKQVLKDEDDVEWYVHETLKESDGSLSRCVIVEAEQ